MENLIRKTPGDSTVPFDPRRGGVWTLAVLVEKHPIRLRRAPHCVSVRDSPRSDEIGLRACSTLLAR
jgi:hypothetical protein